ncbi:MAG: GNAT family N-acetyltransferase [Treponema sp.]|nr:GNAT family N-acetyltransferase [Treponema sp.]
MQFVPVDDLNRQQVLAFITPHEAACAALTENIRRKADDIFALEDDCGNVSGVIGAKRTILHCLPDAGNAEKSALIEPELRAFLHGRKAACINGEKYGTEFILRILASDGIQPAAVNHYTLMTQPQEKFRAVILPQGWRIVHCHEKDADTLMSLQSAYEKEEVLPVCRTFSASVVLQNLEHTLRTEYVLSLQTNRGAFVAKANTNAIGINYIQIGGVYTDPGYRRHHYAALLVSTLVHKIYTVKKRPVLFVKDSNAAASQLYNSLGFVKSDSFVIAYL